MFKNALHSHNGKSLWNAECSPQWYPLRNNFYCGTETVELLVSSAPAHALGILSYCLNTQKLLRHSCGKKNRFGSLEATSHSWFCLIVLSYFRFKLYKKGGGDLNIPGAEIQIRQDIRQNIRQTELPPPTVWNTQYAKKTQHVSVSGLGCCFFVIGLRF